MYDDDVAKTNRAASDRADMKTSRERPAWTMPRVLKKLERAIRRGRVSKVRDLLYKLNRRYGVSTVVAEKFLEAHGDRPIGLGRKTPVLRYVNTGRRPANLLSGR